MPQVSGPESVRAKVRHFAGETLRRSPAPLKKAVKRGSTRLLNAVEPPAPAAHDLVWQSPPLPLPPQLSYEEYLSTLNGWSVNGEPEGHLANYVADSSSRFLYTWNLVRNDRGRCLELGANPYFTTWLLDTYTDLDLTLANYYGETGERTETVSWLPPGASERVEVQHTCSMFNVEEDDFPYPDDSFDVVIFCEMIEHMLMDPLATLRQINRVLAPGGVLILTTPNVARMENVLRLLHGANLYDPYSGFGPYGRHNREFTRHELHRLLEFAGFDVEGSMTADGHPTDHTAWPLYDAAAPLVRPRKEDLGHYLYLRARVARAPREGLPSFLYRSYPDGVIVDYD